MFTSGSTGDPKGVVIPCRNLQTFVDWLVPEQQFVEQGEVFLDQAPFSFDLSVMELYPCLVTGNTLFSLHQDETTNPAQLYTTLARSQVTTWVSTPSFARLCLMEKSFAQAMLPRLSRFLFCGETLAVDLAARLRERFPQAAVWNTYGPTEATVTTTSIRIDAAVLETYVPLPVGYPQPESRVHIVDEADRPVLDGERGQIVIAGRPDLTQKAFFTSTAYAPTVLATKGIGGMACCFAKAAWISRSNCTGTRSRLATSRRNCGHSRTCVMH